jgi:hypothetical protein
MDAEAFIRSALGGGEDGEIVDGAQELRPEFVSPEEPRNTVEHANSCLQDVSLAMQLKGV